MKEEPDVYRVGIDVGGTNTDAVVLQDKTVLAGVKASTTEDVTSGVIEALEKVIEASGIDRARIGAVMIGTRIAVTITLAATSAVAEAATGSKAGLI